MPSVTAPFLVVCLAALGPLALLVTGLLPVRRLGLTPAGYARRATAASVLAFVAALLAGAAGLVHGAPVDFSWPPSWWLPLGLYLDRLSLLVLVLVSFLLAVVAAFATNYLAGEPGQPRFTRWLCLTGAAVLCLVLSGHLVQFALAWCATSLGLHQLLLYYRERPAAVLAARKKFLISRAGDVCLAAAIVLIAGRLHTWNFAEILARAPDAGAAWPIQTACVLLALGAMLKSAQFPFHSWLPDTMETPTPVSALMHAGIINAGGYLVLRLAPLLAQSPAALGLLALSGAFTAAFASLVMLTHASVKRALAFSTVAQMGFMMLEAGLGAFDLALLHLVAHSLYKAHAFLASGGAVSSSRSPAHVLTHSPRPLALGRLALALVVSVGAVALGARLFPISSAVSAGPLLLSAIFVTALAHLLHRFWRERLDFPRLALGVALALLLTASYRVWHGVFAGVGAPLGWDRVPDSPPAWVTAGVIVLAGLLLGLHLALESRRSFRWLDALYVHARNGFYFNPLANRAVSAVWPVRFSPRPSSS